MRGNSGEIREFWGVGERIGEFRGKNPGILGGLEENSRKNLGNSGIFGAKFPEFWDQNFRIPGKSGNSGGVGVGIGENPGKKTGNFGMKFQEKSGNFGGFGMEFEGFWGWELQNSRTNLGILGLWGWELWNSGKNLGIFGYFGSRIPGKIWEFWGFWDEIFGFLFLVLWGWNSRVPGEKKKNLGIF